ncbi:MAG: hypothetical protein KA206_09855 [Paludibacter sp.]|nr:hypothetical protein [Paludibacter sp.]
MRKKIVQQLDMYLIAVVILASSFLANNAVFAQQADSVKLLITKPVYRANLNKHDYFVGGTLSLNSKEIVNKDALVLNIDDQLSNSISLGIDAGYALKITCL